MGIRLELNQDHSILISMGNQQRTFDLAVDQAHAEMAETYTAELILRNIFVDHAIQQNFNILSEINFVASDNGQFNEINYFIHNQVHLISPARLVAINHIAQAQIPLGFAAFPLQLRVRQNANNEAAAAPFAPPANEPGGPEDPNINIG